MTIFQILALILTAAALGGYINHKFVGLPETIGHMAFALLFSGIAIVVGELGLVDVEPIREIVGSIDFSDVLLHGMLSFLLFAGALHINLDELKNVRWAVGILATIGVVLATFITGSLIFYAAQLVGIDMPFIFALLFGALISPTDPIAVLSILKQAGISRNLYTKIGGESLFNDGVAVVTFLAILAAATTSESFTISEFVKTIAYESFGGLGLGLLLGYGVYGMMRSVDNYKVEAMLTLALVAGGYSFAEFIHVSAPFCMVAAGLVIGNQARCGAMSDTTRDNLDLFWELIDEVLNAVLFLLIGLEIMIVPISGPTILLGVLACGAVLTGRFLSVGFPVTAIRFFKPIEKGTIRYLTWGGLRGGLSIAMALSIPNSDIKQVILTLTYIVVLFSIFGQGLTFKRFIQHSLKG